MSDNLKDYEKAVGLFKALGNPVRLCMLDKMIENGKCNVSELEKCLETSQSGISQHLSKLKNTGIIEGKRSGNEIHYELINDQVKKVVEEFLKIEN